MKKDFKVEKTCETCNIIFKVHRYRKDTARFCGHKCYAKSIIGTKQPQSQINKRVKAIGDPWNKGKKHSAETLKKLSDSQKIRFSKEPAWNKGLKGFMSGEQHYRWSDNKTYSARYQRLKNSLSWKEWRQTYYSLIPNII